MKINIKPLSVNGAWQGKRFKTKAYKQFEQDLLFLLPKDEVTFKMIELHYTFGFSSRGCDLGNPEKLVTDILCKKYGFDDNQIYKIVLNKEIVPKGCEFISFKLYDYLTNQTESDKLNLYL